MASGVKYRNKPQTVGAEKYRSKPDPRRTLYLHITGEPIVKLAEGDEPHAPPPSKSDAELYNLIDWILSRTR